MPRTTPPRRPVGLRLSATEEAPLIEIAQAEFDGCLSEAIRALLAEAVATRQERSRREP